MTKSLDHANRSHAKYGPSSMKRLIECPASAFLGQDLDDPPPSPHAAEGQLAHECAEIMLAAKLEGRPYPNLDVKLYDPQMQRHGKAYADYVYGVVEEALFTEHAYFIEKRVHLDKDRDIWGTADFVMAYEKGPEVRLIVIDYKYGAGVPVTTEDNWQLITYGLAAASEFKGSKPITSVECHIFQPRTDHETPPVEYNLDELQDKYYPRIIETIDKIEEWVDTGALPEANLEKYHKAGSWCQFCKVKGVCKPYREAHTGKGLHLFREMAKKLSKKEMSNPDAVVGVLSEEEIADICLNATGIKKFVDCTVKAATSIMSRGKQIKGIKMVERSAKRSWISDEDKLVAGLVKLGVSNPVETVTKVRTITEIEKEVGKGKLAGLTRQAGVNYKIVSEDDPTPEARFGLDTKAMFKEIVEERQKND